MCTERRRVSSWPIKLAYFFHPQLQGYCELPFKMAAEEVEEDSVQIFENKKAKKLHGVSQNTRLVIDLNRDNSVLYDKKCKDYGNQVATKVFSPILVKF